MVEAVKQFIQRSDSTDNTLVYVQNGEQPAIKFIASDPTQESVVQFVTTADHRKMLSFHARQDDIAITSVNVGTLTEPRYEDRQTRTTSSDFTCHVN